MWPYGNVGPIVRPRARRVSDGLIWASDGLSGLVWGSGEEEVQGGRGELGRAIGVHLVPDRNDLSLASGTRAAASAILSWLNVTVGPAGNDQCFRGYFGQPFPPGRIRVVELSDNGRHHGPVEWHRVICEPSPCSSTRAGASGAPWM
jgi:hypothetical protein